MLRCPAVLFATLIAFSIHTSVADESDSARVISPAHQLRVTDTDVTSLHAAEGEYCFAGTRVGEIVVFRFADGRFTELKRWRAHTEAINDITYRNGIVFTASNDGYLKAWDLDTGERQWQTREHKNIDFTCVAYDSKRSIIWTGDSGGELRGYEAGSGESVASRKVHENMIFGLSYHREPDVLISLGHEGAIKMLKAPALESVGEATVSDDTAYAIDYDGAITKTCG